MSDETFERTYCDDFIDLFKDNEKRRLACYVKEVVDGYLGRLVYRKSKEDKNKAYKSFFQRVQNETGYSWDESLNATWPFWSMMENWRKKETKSDANHAIATYYWFHVFAKSPNYAKMIDSAAFGEGISFEQFKNIKIPGKKYENAQKEEFYCYADKNERLNHNTNSQELTKEQRQRIIDQIIAFGDDGLLSSQITFPDFKSDYIEQPITGELYCKSEYVDLKCDGLDYDFKISLNGVLLKFETEGVSFKETTYKSDDIPVIHYWRSQKKPYEWQIIIKEQSKDKELQGNLLRSTNGILFYAIPDRGAKFIKIVSSRLLMNEHLIVESLSKIDSYSVNKERIISELIKQEIILTFSNQVSEYNIEFPDYSPVYDDSATQRIHETVSKISNIQASVSCNFMTLFRLSGLPNDAFKNKDLSGLDFSDADLTELDLTGTKMTDCITNENTFLPDSLKKVKETNDIRKRISDITDEEWNAALEITAKEKAEKKKKRDIKKRSLRHAERKAKLYD